jgi:hypothetical protein
MTITTSRVGYVKNLRTHVPLTGKKNKFLLSFGSCNNAQLSCG